MKSELIIRPIKDEEISVVSQLLSTGYFDDEFFIWSVPDDHKRHKIVADYYKEYLRADGCVANVAELPEGGMVGASVWLPHDTDPSVHEKIDKITGVYAPQFNEVGNKSHLSEPPMGPFYQLVGFVVLKDFRGRGIGKALLKYHLDIFDDKGIPTYLEASTPYFGGGAYGGFKYQQVGELMEFVPTAVLYPLWRPVASRIVDFSKEIIPKSHEENLECKINRETIEFGGYDWYTLKEEADKVLLLSAEVIGLEKYHDTFEDVTWEDSSIRKFLNNDFYDSFKSEEKLQIAPSQMYNEGNPWYSVSGGQKTIDRIFLLSIEEVVRYLGDNGQLRKPNNKYFIDDKYNLVRSAKYLDGSPSRWMLRTPGNSLDFVATVTIEGKIAMTGDFVNRPSTDLFNVGIRPSMWIKKA